MCSCHRPLITFIWGLDFKGVERGTKVVPAVVVASHGVKGRAPEIEAAACIKKFSCLWRVDMHGSWAGARLVLLLYWGSTFHSSTNLKSPVAEGWFESNDAPTAGDCLELSNARAFMSTFPDRTGTPSVLVDT